MRSLTLALLFSSLAAGPVAAEIYTWVDEDGITHFADEPDVSAGPPPGRSLRDLWGRQLIGVPAPRPSPGGLEDKRLRRLLSGAESDIDRGETARAEAVLMDVLRRQPDQPDAHWLLAQISRGRGHYDSAEVHFHAFLSGARAEDLERRRQARRALVELADERRLADEGALAAEASWVGVEHPHFRVQYDAALGTTSDRYADTVLTYLEAAHADVGARLGSVPDEPLGVMFYAKAAYARAHAHRFSFRTVGFFDGRIHVVSAAHPSEELRALLFHEYTHAVFRERTGGDRPFWLNEGMAELSERSSRSDPPLTRTERSWLRRRIDAGDWIPLRRLAPSFAGLDDEDARAAYLEATAAATWIERRTSREQRRRLLDLVGRGHTDDEALFAVMRVDTEEVDRAVREWIRSEFAPARLARSSVR